MSVICISYLSLDAVAADPGGWLFRFGPEPIGGDRFDVGETLREGALLLGRGTWQEFAELWPSREGELPDRMNATEKLVASRSLDDVSGWANSSVLKGDLVEAVRNERRDLVVMGSASLVRQLAQADLVDEYRLMTVPTVLGAGERYFTGGAFPRAEFDVVEAAPSGPFAYLRLRRSAR